MSRCLRNPSKLPILLNRCLLSQSSLSVYHGQLLSVDWGEGEGGKRRRGGQVCLLGGSSLPLSRLFYSSPNRGFHCSHRQVPFLLSHSSSLPFIQEKLPLNFKTSLSPKLNLPLNFKTSPSAHLNLRLNFKTLLSPSHNFPVKAPELSARRFSSFTNGGEDSGAETDEDDENGGCENENSGENLKSNADPAEVERVCKVIDELFALDRNMEAVLDECGIELSHDLVMDVLERFRHARKPAFRFFCWAGEKPGFAHGSRTYNSMIRILAKTRQFETMISILEEMGGKGLLTMYTFTIAMRAFAAAKERKKAVGIFELMKKYKYKVDVETFNCLLDSLGRAKLGKEAQALFQRFEDKFMPNLRTYTVLLNGWCRVKNLMEAGRIWNEMIDNGFKPDIVVHNIMLEGLLKSKKRSDAIKLFEVMKAKGPFPDVRSYTALIRDLCKQSKMKEAVEYFEEMVDAGCKPDAAVYTCLLTGFGNQKRMDIVCQILKEMKQNGCLPDGQTYNSLIKLMTSRRMPDDALGLYKKMTGSGIEPTIHTYNMIMKSYFRTRNFEMGHAVWDEMRKKGCCPDDNSYTVLIGGLISQGRSGEACKYLEEMMEKGMKAPTLDYDKFAADFSRSGNPCILEDLAQKMKFSGKFEVSNFFARSAESLRRKRVTRRSGL